MISSHNTDIENTFYNDKVLDIVDAGIMAESFTYVPIKAGHMELVGGNAIVFGQITEGEDVIIPEITTEISYEDVSAGVSRNNLLMVPFMSSTIMTPIPLTDQIIRTVSGYLIVTLPATPVANDIYYITIASIAQGISSRTATYTVLAGDTTAALKAGLLTSLNAHGFVVAAGSPAGEIWLYNVHRDFPQIPTWVAGDINTIFADYTYSAYILTLGNTIKYPELKCGASHSFGIVYKDRSGRQCSVMPIDAVYIPFYTEPNGMNNLLTTIVKLKFKILNAPPDWAETYEIVYFGNNSMDYFMQIRESDIAKLSYGTYRYSMNVQMTFDWTYLQNNRWKVGAYSWEMGDRVRLIGTIDPSTGIITKYTVLYDYEVESTSDRIGSAISGDWLIFQAKNHPHDLDLGTTAITNLTGNLNGTVVHTQANDPTVPKARIDTITLTGGSGTAKICVGTLEKTATWNASGLTQTATDFKNANAAAYLAVGITLTSSGADLIFTASVAGVDFLSPTNILVELYRPKKGLGQTIAYGTGMVFDIATDSNGNKYHKGDVNQVFSAVGICTTQAEVKNTANDCWKFDRLNYAYLSGSVEPFWAESIFPSDWWGGQVIDNKLTSCGFPFLYDLSLKQMVLDERIRNGGFLLTGTSTNNIAHFTFDSFRDLPEKDGPITGLREVGYTLKVIQEHQETSIYVNRVQTFNPDGTSQFTLTDTFLGVMRPMDDNYGCQHPDSIVANNRNLYYWDNNEGAFIRSDPNGQKVLSGPEYKMSRWFKDLLRWIQTSGGSSTLEVRIGINNEHEEVWVTFRMADDVRGLIFSEKEGRFISEINQITESYVHLGNFFAHLYRQTLWIMNVDEGQDYLSWNGVPTYAEVEVVSNIEPTKIKVFNAIALFADHLLQSLAKYIHIPTQASENNILMESNAPVWNRREGVYFGQIMKDENTPGTFASVYDAKLNGREMRGRYCYLKFYTDEHAEKVRVHSIVIFSTPSERSV